MVFSNSNSNSNSKEVAIRVEGVSRDFRMGSSIVRALDGVSFQVKAGEFVALLGSSGSGKSTLLNLVAGLDRPTAGSIHVLGNELASMSSQALARYRREAVGIVFQAFNLIPSMTTLENVELPMRFAEVERGARGERARVALREVGLEARMSHRPSELSGGEQQRVALARALVNRPSLLLADEPTGNLDSRTGEGILNLVRQLNLSRGMTVILVTHERALADRFAQRGLMLADGRLVGEGNPGGAPLSRTTAGLPEAEPLGRRAQEERR
jgi:ABC-type lipoprotein export system ATPase subunit